MFCTRAHRFPRGPGSVPEERASDGQLLRYKQTVDSAARSWSIRSGGFNHLAGPFLSQFTGRS